MAQATIVPNKFTCGNTGCNTTFPLPGRILFCPICEGEFCGICFDNNEADTSGHTVLCPHCEAVLELPPHR